MSKTKIIFVCNQCGSQFTKWQGQCTGCGEWNTIGEDVQLNKSTHPARAVGYSGGESQLTLLADVKMQQEIRLSTDLEEFDHVLGGGLVSDSVVLVGGDPGIGKSTLLLQILCQLSTHHSALYISGEESLQQLAMRAKRLGLPDDRLMLLAETNIERIIAIAQKLNPKVIVIDSIQTMYTETLPAAPGGVGQVRESTAHLVRFAKQYNVALFLVGHVTKEGAIAGPRVLEHMVDAVLYFEGQSDSRYRIIRAVKNRFGAVNEIGVFAMTDRGLKPVNNPSAIFLSGYHASVPGSTVMVTWEGSRPLLVEIQALVDESHLANPRRVTVGLDANRLSMLLAVLHQHVGVATYAHDVFVNVVGGLRIAETGVDLALLLAVISSLKNRPLPVGLIIFGEVGLSGEIRPVTSGQERLKEAEKHGFQLAIVPQANAPKTQPGQLKVHAVSRLQEALSVLSQL